MPFVWNWGDLSPCRNSQRELATKRERVFLLTNQNSTHFDNVVEVEKGEVKLKNKPEDVVFISAKTSTQDPMVATVA